MDLKAACIIKLNHSLCSRSAGADYFHVTGMVTTELAHHF